MKLTRIEGHFPGEDADFNHPAAEAVFETIMKMDDDEAALWTALIVGTAVQNELAVHQTAIAKALAPQMEANLRDLGSQLGRKAIAKQLNGEDASAELDAVELLAKAFDGSAFSSEERARRAQEQHRDINSGKFVRQHEKIYHTQTDAVPEKIAAKLGIPEPASTLKLSKEQRRVFQSGYRQVQQMVRGWDRLPAGEGLLHLVYGDGTETIHDLPKSPGNGASADVPLDPTKTLIAAKVSVVPSLDAPGAAFSTFDAVGLPRVGAAAGGAMADGGMLHPGTLRDSFEPEWNRTLPSDTFNPSHKLFRRLGAGSKLIDDSFGDAIPPRLKMALAAGRHVGELGPEAQKVIGPGADRAAYRYRGTPKTPDQTLVNAVEAIQRDPRLRPADKREVMIHGIDGDTPDDWNPSALLRGLRRLLPKQELNTLHRKSGTIPPSQGIILDRTGKIAAQSVGFGDDHYLPFDFTKLAKLKGGEYLRTRTWGGPTTEDVYTGLMSGARALTVASHNGVYTVEFDPTFKGGKRFNDKAARMVARYGQLLDAVKHGEISNPLHPSRMAELETQANREYDRDEEPERYQAQLQKLLTRERRDPQLSKEQRNAAAADYFTELAGNTTTPDGHEMTAADMTQSWALNQTKDAHDKHVKGYLDMARARDAYVTNHPGEEVPPLQPRTSHQAMATARLTELRDPDPVRAAEKTADAMGVRRQFDAHMRRAEEQNKVDLKPLQLNGEGYDTALKALQEQFPYYISRVEYHRWNDGAPGGNDTGYVMPKHNRPKAVLAGYFAPELGGKVHAHTIRNQNGNAVPVPYKAAAKRGSLTPTARPTGPSGSTVVSGPVDPEIAEALRTQSVRAMVAEIKAHDSYSPSVTGNDVQRSIANQPIAGEWLDALKGSPDLHFLLTTDDSVLEKARVANPKAYRDRVAAAIKQNAVHNFLDLNTDTVKEFHNEGKPDPIKHLNDRAVLALNDAPGTDYAFTESHFHPGNDRTVQELSSAYLHDARIKPLLDAGLLTPNLGDGADFKTSADVLRKELQAKWGARVKASVAPGFNGGARLTPEHDLNRQTEGLLRAEQLRRRYVEAERRQTVVTTPTETEPGNETHFHFGEGFDPSKFGFDPTKVISQ